MFWLQQNIVISDLHDTASQSPSPPLAPDETEIVRKMFLFDNA